MQRLNTLKRGLLLLGVLVLGLVLAACGGDDNDNDGDQPVPDQPAPELVTETDVPDVASVSMATPFAPLPDVEFGDAVEVARADLAIRLDVRATEIDALPPDSEALLGQPEICPDLPNVELDLYYVYLQHKRFIYPYQVYWPHEPNSQMVVEACEDVFVDEDVLYIPTPDSRVAISEQVLADLAGRGVDTAQGEFRVVREMTWTDERLGCPVLPGEQAPKTKVIDGFLMLFEANGITYEYHTDKTGDQIAYCAPPPGYATPEDLITALQDDVLAEPQIVEDEVAVVEGLDGEGVLVSLTNHDFRIGLFGYGSNEQARAAATLITDLSVWRAFVSDRVLIVLYDVSSPAYSLLLKYGDEVSLPSQDFSDPADLTPEPAVGDGA